MITVKEIKGSEFPFEKYERISFYESGEILSGRLALSINRKMNCFRKHLRWEIDTRLAFYEDGSVMLGTLSFPVELDRHEGVFLKDKVTFYSNGMVKSGHVNRPCKVLVGGKWYEVKESVTPFDWIGFHENGEVRRLYVSGTAYKDGKDIYFDEEGREVEE